MTPREKAIEILDKIQYKRIEYITIKMNTDHDAKFIANNLIDEIISACEYNNVETWNTDWWNKVRNEIELL